MTTPISVKPEASLEPLRPRVFASVGRTLGTQTVGSLDDLESSSLQRSDELSVLIPTSRHLFISSSSHTDSWEGNLPKDSIDAYGYV